MMSSAYFLGGVGLGLGLRLGGQHVSGSCRQFRTVGQARELGSVSDEKVRE